MKVNLGERIRELAEEQLTPLQKLQAKRKADQEEKRQPVGGRGLRRWARAAEREQRKASVPGEREIVAHRRRVRPGARQLFEELSERRFQSRPILEPARVEKRPVTLADGTVEEQNFYVEAVRGEPTFRNVIDENGRHV